MITEEGTICLAKSCRKCNKKLIDPKDKAGAGNICRLCRLDYAKWYNKKRAEAKKKHRRF